MADPRQEIHAFIDDQVGARPEAGGEILDALSDAVRKTAEHVRVNWQDRAAAAAWDNIAKSVDRTLDVYEKRKPF